MARCALALGALGGSEINRWSYSWWRASVRKLAMKASLLIRRGATITLAVTAASLIMTAAFFVAVNAGYGRTLLIRLVASRVGRPIEVKGTLQAHLFSRTPRLVAEGVTIGNPPWTPVGVVAEVGKVTVTLTWPGSVHPFGITNVAMEGATLHLLRDSTGHANWQLTDPDQRRAHRNSPIVRSLSLPDAHVVLADDLRHRHFVGTVSAEAPSGAGSGPGLRIDGTGQLNGRAVSFKLTGDPLATARHDHPYHFTFVERSSGSRLEARGVLPQPFDFTVVDSAFEATGPDLKDLYFLTGIRLLDTGDYHLSAQASRRGKRTEYRDLVLTSGRSDLNGTVSIDSSGARQQLALDLNSQVIYLSDLGLRAAGRTSEPESPLLLSDTAVSPTLLRSRDATIRFRAHTVQVGRLPLHEVSVKATIDHGVLTVTPLVADVLGGTVETRLRLDARKEVPAANLDLRITDLQLGQLSFKDPGVPPIEGPLQAWITITGAGSSLHQVAASANGTVKAQLPHGAMRAAFAESAGGIDLRGLGLVLTHDQREVPVRCATAEFKAEDGTLIAQNMIADTDPIVITGAGRIHLDTEALELEIHGQAKKLRFFRLRAPVLVRGTLAHPSIAIQKSKSIPVLLEPGKAKDTDCTELLAEANSGGAPAQTSR